MRITRAVTVMVLASACTGSSADKSPAPDSLRTVAPSVAASALAPSTWPSEIGDFVALLNPASGEAMLFRQDSSRVPRRAAAVGYDSVATVVTLDALRAVPCAARATLRLENAPPGWSLALDSTHARPLLIDGLDDLSPRDSARTVVRIQRALNALPDSGDAMEFRGLPVVVRDAWIVYAPTPLLVARAARQRNTEASAHEELRFVVLEGDLPRYVARVAGEEEAVESWDLLAALQVDGRLWLAVAREGAGATQLEFLARDSTTWKSVWRSDALTCAGSR